MNTRSPKHDNPTIGYWSVLGGVEVKYFDDDNIYCISHAWEARRNYGYHILPLHFDEKGMFVKLYGHKLYADELICDC